MNPRYHTTWLSLIVLSVGYCLASAGAAEYRTKNFIVTARDARLAQQIGDAAEEFRRQKALDWLGMEMPTWGSPCPIEVKITYGESGGATSFSFDRGRIISQHMKLEGTAERILNSVLPHEVTHTVFAFKFRRPLPRWADEGGAVLSEDFEELKRHDLLVREVINYRRMIPLSRLFVLTEYPDDVMALYAQGFSVANYLVTLRGKRAFLDFVWEGQERGWERAIQKYYEFHSVEQLEKKWIDWIVVGHGTGADYATREAFRGAFVYRPVTDGRGNPSAGFADSRDFVFRGQSPDGRMANGQGNDGRNGDGRVIRPVRPMGSPTQSTYGGSAMELVNRSENPPPRPDGLRHLQPVGGEEDQPLANRPRVIASASAGRNTGNGNDRSLADGAPATNAFSRSEERDSSANNLAENRVAKPDSVRIVPITVGRTKRSPRTSGN